MTLSMVSSALSDSTSVAKAVSYPEIANPLVLSSRRREVFTFLVVIVVMTAAAFLALIVRPESLRGYLPLTMRVLICIVLCVGIGIFCVRIALDIVRRRPRILYQGEKWVYEGFGRRVAFVRSDVRNISLDKYRRTQIQLRSGRGVLMFGVTPDDVRHFLNLPSSQVDSV